MANTSFPDSAVVYILDDIPGLGEFQGTGVVIGPHSILTAAHLVYDSGTGATADAVSLYPGFTPDTTAYNPAGALGGFQSIHTIKVADGGDSLSAQATQSDFAVIDTSADLSAYGSFALDPGFTSGDVVVKGYPSSSGGHLSGAEGVVGQDGTLSDIDTSSLPLSPGYSGGPLFDIVERNGSDVPAVVGTVSTSRDAMKLTRAKVALIRHWIASDQSLYAGGQDAPKGLVPQIAGTASAIADAAAVPARQGTSALDAVLGASGDPSSDAAIPPAFTYTDLAAPGGGPAYQDAMSAVPGGFAELVDALQTPRGGGDAAVTAPATEGPSTFASPFDSHHGRGWTTEGA